MNFNSHLDVVVGVAVRLVNASTSGQRQGRDYAAPEGDELATAINAAVATDRTSRPLSTSDATSLAARVPRLRVVFEALAAGDPDLAATTLNGLMSAVGTMPYLERHDQEPWHLHFHAPGGSIVDSWMASCALGLAVVVGSDHADRLGVCVAQACDRVYVDVSRNGRRRFCSTACQSRTKAAAYRARQAAASA